jgi:hypothetical protein
MQAPAATVRTIAVGEFLAPQSRPASMFYRRMIRALVR